MIYSASRRTDMAAFFPDDIVGRVRRSRRLEAIVFWTKDIRNLVRHPDLAAVVRTIPSVVQFTVTGLAGGDWEPRVPPLERQLDDLRQLAEALPPSAIQWRFDPILPGPDVVQRFFRVKTDLESAMGPLAGVTVSFPDPYRHAVRRASRAGLEWPETSLAGKAKIIVALAAGFPDSDRPIRLCCESALLESDKTVSAKCIDGELLERLYDIPLAGLEKDPGQRKECGCVKSTDIGSYVMRCGHRCLYCYANPEE